MKKSNRTEPHPECNSINIKNATADNHSNINIAGRDIFINDSKLFELILIELQSLKNEIALLRGKK